MTVLLYDSQRENLGPLPRGVTPVTDVTLTIGKDGKYDADLVYLEARVTGVTTVTALGRPLSSQPSPSYCITSYLLTPTPPHGTFITIEEKTVSASFCSLRLI